MKSDLVDVKYSHIKHETDKAFLFEIGEKDVWIPKSACEVDETASIVTMRDRLATEKEIEDYVL